VTRTNSAFRRRLCPEADGDEINPSCTRLIRGWRDLARAENGERSSRGRGDGDGDRRVRSPTADVSELDPADSWTSWVAGGRERGRGRGLGKRTVRSAAGNGGGGGETETPARARTRRAKSDRFQGGRSGYTEWQDFRKYRKV
jgi:hypothetical protein